MEHDFNTLSHAQHYWAWYENQIAGGTMNLESEFYTVLEFVVESNTTPQNLFLTCDTRLSHL
jgi:hypothetical protein